MFRLQKFQFDTDKMIAERLSKDSLSTASRCDGLSFFVIKVKRHTNLFSSFYAINRVNICDYHLGYSKR